MGWFGIIGRLIAKCKAKTFPKAEDDLKLDEDVVSEANRVAKGSNQDFTVKVQDFRKVYSISKGCACGKSVRAVEKLSFGVESGECFALLGVNGAGKTTTFKSLTNEIVPTSGSISIQGMDIKNEFKKIR
mmetsp:Transcript_36985/g.26871  ORF Transcript_36985/g.26871 Transcript_36985/m.26871 type:complete len:130 (+) Transcript_36985:1395-1784(+)|eukprot:CAMPEP_0116872914 /NCGR_PEP_ID=MMETSP0463-20121206/3840_1 /TAXON_ID=181622 /ORGANISM="Strombidinopsis sp, Strain SopsisLIS2011" /LENGTH=129 /DNA_ID=CAMNT_0004513963 /DNA_START=4323 /DNA_END=4712 /DNA_ORIENTATION=+